MPGKMDLRNNPDLAQTFAFLAVAADREITLTGLDNLRIKETDRLAALKTELEKLGVNVSVSKNSIRIRGPVAEGKADVKTYNDHRMAMSAAILSCGAVHENAAIIGIEGPHVVEKSFSGFWKELETLGFQMT